MVEANPTPAVAVAAGTGGDSGVEKSLSFDFNGHEFKVPKKVID